MDLEVALRTTGAVREFLPDPVPDAVVTHILDVARFAPSGGNRQGWRVIVVRDPAGRAAVRDVYRAGWDAYVGQLSEGRVPFSPLADPEAPRPAPPVGHRPPGAGAPNDFADHLDQVPVLLLVLADLRVISAVDKDLPRYTFAGGASIYPFVWSLLLAARLDGVGGVMTTLSVPGEAALKTRFDIPDEMALAALVALGYPRRQPSRLSRRAVDEFSTVDRFGGAGLQPEAPDAP